MNQTTGLSEQQVDDIADALSNTGYIYLQDFLPEQLVTGLRQEAVNLAEKSFTLAGIGRQHSQNVDTQVRTDSTLWFDGQTPAQQAYLDVMEQLRIGLNRRLFMGLFDFECHYSHYKKGDFYQRHLDAFKGKSNRILSTVFYLNPDWSEEEGGELCLYAQDAPSKLLKVLPLFNQCIIFLSDTFPHEVLESQNDRYSIAGWYRLNNTSSEQLDPSQ